MRYRIETVLLINTLLYLMLGCGVVLFGVVMARTGGTVDLALSVDLLGVAAKGFVVGMLLLIVNEMSD